MADRAARFDALYRGNPDPWSFRTSDYEQAKYAATLAVLPRQRYAVGIEVGCSIGELTRRLGNRCDRVIGLDVSGVAIEQARRRHGSATYLSFIVGEVPAFWPAVRADLIVLSEILYFLDATEIEHVARRVAAGWSDGGDCVLVNYLGPIDGPLDGDGACERFIAALAGLRAITMLAAVRAPDYRLDLLCAGGLRSS